MLRVLFIEDNIRDMKLSIQALEKAGYKLKSERAETQQELETLLQNFQYDIVLCDKHLPGWGAKEAIRYIKEHDEDATIILLSGTTNHAEALKHIEDGAADYLLKDHLVRLPFAVERSLHEKEEHDKRIEAEQQLKKNEALFRALVENSYDSLSLIDQTGKVTYVSHSLERMIGYSANDLMSMDRLVHVHPDDVQKSKDSFEESKKNPSKPISLQLRIKRKDGSWIWIDLVRTNLLADENVRGIVCNIRNITAEKDAEEKLIANEVLFRSLIENSHDALVLLDEKGRFFYVSAAVERITGYSVSELLTTDRDFHVHADDVMRSRGAITESSAKPGIPVTVQLRIHRKDGSLRWLEIICTNHLADPFVKGFVCNVRDITEQKTASETILQQEITFRSLIENAPYGIYRSNSKVNHFLSVNPALVSMLGYSSAGELLKARLFEDIYVDPKERQKLLDELKGKPTYAMTLQWKRKNGGEITVKLKGTRVHSSPIEGDNYEVFVENITEQIKMEKQYRQAQKMEAVGLLAGGIAHDFNNLLGIIIGQSELLDEKLSENRPLQKRVSEISKAGKRAAALTRQLLVFSRNEKAEMRLADLNQVVKECEKLLARLIGENITLKFELHPGPLMVHADQGQVGQVLMNLVINARDAITKTGHITVTTSLVRTDETGTGILPPGEYAQFEVRDTGGGISPEIRDSIFDPFFTTKKEMGTGLGLSTSYAIVEQHNGTIRVASELGVGTTFTVDLPIYESNGDENEKDDRSIAPEKIRTETILFAEDEPAFRELVSELLENRGYNVLKAPNGAAALEMSDMFEEPIHRLITDVLMPEMNGADLAAKLKVKRPDMKVLFISGYTDDILKRHGDQLIGMPLLMKPFTQVDLAKKVRDVLDGK